MPDRPMWKGTSLDSPITKVAIPLIVFRDGVGHPSGTACVIAPSLAITARHVVEDHFQRFEGRSPSEGGDATYYLCTYVVPRRGEVIPLFVHRTWASSATDIAVLWLVPACDLGPSYVWPTARIDVLPPREGTKIFAFGYPNSRFETGEGDAAHTLHLDATTTTGRVEEVHYERRDSVRLPFPCFRTDARFDGGMSGGPVFNENGQVCGLVCSNMPPATPDGEHISYVSTLWPILGTLIDAPWDRYPAGSKYPLIEYARAGINGAINLDRVDVEILPDGEPRTTCTYSAAHRSESDDP